MAQQSASTPALASLLISLAILGATPPATALTRSDARPPAPAVSTLLGHAETESVASIPSVERIEHWETLGTQHVLLSVDASRTYLLTLSRNCHSLSWAQSVNVSRSGSVIWAEFDYLKVDGTRCAIGEIHQLSRNAIGDAVQALTPADRSFNSAGSALDN